MKKGDGRNAVLVRTLSLMRLLDGRKRWTLDELADHFDVCPRTIRRDLYAIREAGHSIRQEGAQWWTA